MKVSLAQLRAARAMLAWTSDEFARRACVHPRTVRKLERGSATPQRGTLSRIVGALEAGGVEFKGARRPTKKRQNGILRPVSRARSGDDRE